MSTDQLVRFAGSFVGAVQTPLVVLDKNLRVLVANRFFDDLAGDPGDLRGKDLLRLNDGRWDLPVFRSALERVLPEGRNFERCDLPGREGRRLLASGSGLQPDEQPASMVLLSFAFGTSAGSTGVSALRQGNGGGNTLEDALVVELAHRVKNLLAMVQSLALQTNGADVASYRRAFLSRMKAIALAYGSLLETSLERASLHGLLRELLAPFLQGSPQRVVLEGPPVSLSARQVTIFALLVHELAGNAARHGALSVPDGRVLLSWQNVNGLLQLHWQEQGAPAGSAVPEPGGEDDGFGTKLIRRAVAYQLGGTAELFSGPGGLHCSLVFPLKDAA